MITFERQCTSYLRTCMPYIIKALFSDKKYKKDPNDKNGIESGIDIFGLVIRMIEMTT